MGAPTEINLLDNLKNVGYQGDLADQTAFDDALQSGLKSLSFINLISWLSTEIKTLGNLDEKIEPCNETESGIDVSGFMMELSAFLKELNCPYQFFISGPMSARLQSVESRKLLVQYLLSELMCFRKLEINKPTDKAQINLQESSTASTLKSMLIALGFNKPPDNITTTMLFDKLLTKMKDTKQQAGPKRVGKSLLPLNKPLSQKQWQELENLQVELENEYTIRRQMLLTRLDVTIQSFQWSDQAKAHEDAISRIYTVKRNTVNSGSFEVTLSHLLAARDDLAILEKTSNANVRKNTKSDIHKVIIGRVPDRGGRAHEHAPPPPEMPSWQQQRTSGPPGGGGGRGGQGGGRGGFSQNQQQQNRGFQQSQYGNGDQSGGGSSRVQGQWNQQSGGQSNRGGGYSNRGGRGGGYSNRGGFNQNNQSGNYNQGGGYNQSNQGGSYNQGGGYKQASYDNTQDQGYYKSQQGGGYQKGSYSNRDNNQGYYNRGNRH